MSGQRPHGFYVVPFEKCGAVLPVSVGVRRVVDEKEDEKVVRGSQNRTKSESELKMLLLVVPSVVHDFLVQPRLPKTQAADLQCIDATDAV